MTTYSFPDGFVWGSATASYQVEGAVAEDGRGESIWDRFSHTPGRVAGGDTGDVACDHYHRWRDDIALMRSLNLGAYRFSIAWPRVAPDGDGTLNHAGLDFYDRLVDELLHAGIVPYPTLYHWDLPQALEDRGGWRVRATIDAFARFAEVVVDRLGDRVANWWTINEPWVVAVVGHEEGRHAPGRRSVQEARDVAHHVLVAHARAVEVVHGSNAGRVGIVLNQAPQMPRSGHPADVALAHLEDGKLIRWFMDPLAGRGYPEDAMRALGWDGTVVKPGDMEAIAAPIDMLGINFYTVERRAAADVADGGRPAPLDGAGDEWTEMGWEVYPAGIAEVLTRAHREYGHRSLHITENGAAYTVPPVDGRVADDLRRSYLERHLAGVHGAIAGGVPVDGYFVWSLLDNFEWDRGYAMRFGIVHVDYDTQERIVKDSGHWFAGVAARNGFAAG
jgi:beta-glucosidase